MIGALAALALAMPASAVASARCEVSLPAGAHPAGTRFGPLTFAGDWDLYADLPGFEGRRNPQTGLFYAKSALYVRPGVNATVSIAPADRAAADFNYGMGRNGAHVLSDVVRLSSCRRRTAFFSGGLMVREPTCVEVRVRVHRRSYRKVKSIAMGDRC